MCGAWLVCGLWFGWRAWAAELFPPADSLTGRAGARAALSASMLLFAAALCAVGSLRRLVCARSGGRARGSARAAVASLDAAGPLSTCTFWWVMPTLSAAMRTGRLELADMPQHLRFDTTAEHAAAHEHVL